MPELSIWQTPRVANYYSTYRNQKDPDIIGLSNGNILMVWADDNPERGGAYGYDIAGTILGPDGNRPDGVYLPIYLNRDALNAGDETEPSVAATDDGGFVMTYLSNSREQVFLRFDADGNEVSQNIDNPTRNTRDGNADTYSDYNVVFRPDGTSLISQRKEPKLDYDDTIDEYPYSSTYLTSVDAAGNVSNVRGLANSYDDEFYDIEMAVLTDGRTVMTYTSWGARSVYFAVVDTDNDVTATFANQVAQRPGIGFENKHYDIEVAALADGGWVVSYLRGNVIYARSFAADGTANMDEIALVGDEAYKGSVQVIGLPNGGFALGWVDYAARSLSFQSFNADGTVPSDVLSLAFSARMADDLQMSLADDGRILLAWAESSDLFSSVYRAMLDTRDGSDIFVDDGAATTAPNVGATVTGSAARDELIGGHGRDTLIGKQAADDLHGGRHADVLMGGRGHDSLNGAKGDDSIFGGSGRDFASGGSGDDIIHTNSGRDRVRGGEDDDIIYSGAGNDSVEGNEGSDTIYGGAGDDFLSGDGGQSFGYAVMDDTIYGGAGNDTIDGAEGADTMTGGAGRDTFLFNGVMDSRASDADVITDFEITQDWIDLHDLDANVRQRGDQRFDYIGNREFDAAGQVRVERDGDNRIVQIDRNGDGNAEFAIVLENVSGMSRDSFLL